MTAPATHLTWSDEIGKRVRTGDWADQAVSTVTKIRENLREGGDTLGVAVGRRETAAQLVDYFMEEAKVLYGLEDARGHFGTGIRTNRKNEASTSSDPAGAGPMIGAPTPVARPQPGPRSSPGSAPT